jgi:hypothetical protein
MKGPPPGAGRLRRVGKKMIPGQMTPDGITSAGIVMSQGIRPVAVAATQDPLILVRAVCRGLLEVAGRGSPGGSSTSRRFVRSPSNGRHGPTRTRLLCAAAADSACHASGSCY